MKEKDFNVRLLVDEKNEIYLGFVFGFYKKGKDGIMQQGVPASVRERLAKRLNIKLLETK